MFQKPFAKLIDRPCEPAVMKRDRVLWAGQWTVALAFYFIALIQLGLENHLRAAEAVEMALALLAIVPALTEILPQVSTLALALLPVAALALPAHGTGLATVDIALAVLAAIVALGRLKQGYGVPSARSNSSADRLSPGAIVRQRSASTNSASPATPRTPAQTPSGESIWRPLPPGPAAPYGFFRDPFVSDDEAARDPCISF